MPKERGKQPRPETLGKTRSVQSLRRQRNQEGPPQEALDHPRPQTRADCAEGPRPCPFIGCRHHLGLEVKRASLRFPFGDDPDFLERMPATCSLDVADQGDHQSMEVAEYLGMSRQGAGQVEAKALTKLKRELRRTGGPQLVRALRQIIVSRLNGEQ